MRISNYLIAVSLFVAPVAGCPTTQTPSDAGGDTPTPVAECRPAGSYTVTYVADAANGASCPSVTEISAGPIVIGASGQPVDSSGRDAMCNPTCGAGDCTITNAAAPTCSGRFSMRGACSPDGSATDVLYTVTGNTVTVMATLQTTAAGTCRYNGTGARSAS